MVCSGRHAVVPASEGITALILLFVDCSEVKLRCVRSTSRT